MIIIQKHHSGSLWQYYKDEPTDAGAVDDFPFNSASFKLKTKNNR